MAGFRSLGAVIVSSAIIFIFAGIANSQEQNLQSAKAWFDKGMLYREAGDPRSDDGFQQAVRDLNGYIKSGGNNPQGLTRAYTLRARCRNLLGDNGEAIRDLDRAIALSPNDGDIYYLRSFIHEIMGQVRIAIDDLKTAARYGNEKAKDELRIKGIQY